MKDFYETNLKGVVMSKDVFISRVKHLKKADITKLLKLVKPAYLKDNDISIEDF